MVTESADYILSRIVELNREIQMTEMALDIIVQVMLVSGIIAVVSLILRRIWLRTPHYDDRDFLAGIVCLFSAILTVSVACGYAAMEWNLPFMHDQMDALIAAYESVYGPLPEGIL